MWVNSKCSWRSFLQVFSVLFSAIEARPAGHEGEGEVSGGEVGRDFVAVNYTSTFLSVSALRRFVTIANLIVARTAFILGRHLSVSDGDFPPR